MKKIFYVFIICLVLIGSELLIERFIFENQISVVAWVNNHLYFIL